MSQSILEIAQNLVKDRSLRGFQASRMMTESVSGKPKRIRELRWFCDEKGQHYTERGAA